MNEEERRLEILKAEAAIRELAQRMAEAGERTKQADMARSTLESALRSIKELNLDLQAFLESEKQATKEKSESLKQASESLGLGAEEIQKAEKRLEEKADHLETSMNERSQELQESVSGKLSILSQDINAAQEQLSAKADHLETSINESQELQKSVDGKLSILSQDLNAAQEQLSAKADHLETSINESQELQKSVDGKLCNLSQDINTAQESVDSKLNILLQNIGAISNKLLFIMDQNEASNKRILALERAIKDLSDKFPDLNNHMIGNNEEMQELKTQALDFNEPLSSTEQASVAKTSRLYSRLRSAIIGGLGAVMVFMFLRLV